MEPNPRTGVFWGIWSKISGSLACWCITDSLSHVETNKTYFEQRVSYYYVLNLGVEDLQGRNHRMFPSKCLTKKALQCISVNLHLPQRSRYIIHLPSLPLSSSDSVHANKLSSEHNTSNPSDVMICKQVKICE